MPPDKPIYAPLSIVERYHTQENQRWSDHMREHAALNERINEIEKNHALATQRLDTGAEAFKEVRDDLDKLRPPIWKTALFVFAILGSVAGTVGSVVWFAAKTPSQAELKEVRDVVTTMQIQQAKIDEKLDQALKTKP